MNKNEYISWILEQPQEDYTIHQISKDRLELRNDLVTGFVNVYNLEVEIVELRLERNEDREVIFFLHFELKDEDHACSLFKEMTDMIRQLKNKQTVKVLLSCTSGLTTSFFAEKLKEAAATLSLDMTFEAVPFSNLYETAYEYDVILLAPQISYELKKISEIYKNKIVMTIPAQVFAAYDAGTMCTKIVKELEDRKISGEIRAAYRVLRDITVNACIFVINMTHEVGRARLVYCLYDKGVPVYREQVIKQKFGLQDINDILDTEFTEMRKNYNIDAVSIGIPGIMPGGNQDRLIDYESFSASLSRKYGLPVYVEHNTVSIAYGFYAGQTKYDIITYHSQPKGGLGGGQGMVYRGVPIIGSHRASGELGPVLRMFRNDFPGVIDRAEISEIRQAVVNYLLTNIAVFDPEVILVRSELTPDMEELKKELSRYIDEDKLPDLIYVKDISDYACLGCMLYALFLMKNEILSAVNAENPM